MKRILSFALLLSFVVVLSPRSIWHSHSHENEKSQAEIKLTQSQNSFHADDCFVCDFSLSLFTVQKEYSFFNHNLAVVPKPIASESTVERILILYFSRRGPPGLI